MSSASEASRRPRVGVALGGGGVAGLASIGVLREVEAAGIEVNWLAGTSAGAAVGAAHAAGRLDGFRETMLSFDPGRWMRAFEPVWPRRGVFAARRVIERIRPFVGERIEELPGHFAAVAADLDTGDEIVLDRGPVPEAIRASMAIPGLFTPQACRGRLLVDGGLVDPIPVRVARLLGARFVVAVTGLPLEARGARPGPAPVLPEEGDPAIERPAARAARAGWGHAPWLDRPAGRLPHLAEILLRSARLVETEIALLRLRSEPPDFLVTCPVSDIGLFDFSRAAEAEWIGRLAMRPLIGELKRALARAEGAESAEARGTV